MKKYIFVFILLVPGILAGQRTFKKGVQIGEGAPVIDSVTTEVYDTVIWSGNTGINGPRASEYREPGTMFTLRIDDGLSDVYTDWMPFCDSLGIVATVAVVVDSVSSSTYLTNNSDYMTWGQVRALQDSGWEILSHGAADLDWQNLTDAQIETDIKRSRDSLIAQGITVNNIVPPYYSARSLAGRELTRKYYRSSHAGFSIGLIHGFNPPAINPYNLSAMRGDLGGTSYQAERVNGVDSTITAINKALIDKTWGIYFVHTHNAAKAAGLKQIIEHCQDSGVAIVTINQALDTWEPYMTSGRSFSVNERGVRIDRLYGSAAYINDSITRIGWGAGYNNKDNFNTQIGLHAGSNTGGASRIDIGRRAGYYNTAGDYAVNIGARAGESSTAVNSTFIGTNAGYQSTTSFGVAVGYDALNGASGYNSIAFGKDAGRNSTGTRGHFFGNEAGEGNSGTYVLGIGERALFNNSTNYLMEIKINTANSDPLLKGFFNDRALIQGAPSSATDDSNLPNSSMHFYLNEANDSIMIRIKYSDGSAGVAGLPITKD